MDRAAHPGRFFIATARARRLCPLLRSSRTRSHSF
jgi:hypothetical protein